MSSAKSSPADSPSLRIGVRLFGALAEKVGRPFLSLNLPAGAKASLLWDHPSLAPIRSRRRQIRLAINDEFVSEETRLEPGDEVCLFPPMAGGGFFWSG